MDARMIEGVFEIFAYVCLLIGDVVAFCALFGAVLTLLIAIFDAFRGRSPLRAFKLTADWSIGALFLGSLLFSAVLFSGKVDAPATLLFGTSRLTIATMLAMSVTLLISSLVVSRLIRR